MDLRAWAPAVAEFGGIETPEGRAAYLREGVYAALGLSLSRSAAARAAGAPAPAAFHATSDGCPEEPGPGAADDPSAVWRIAAYRDAGGREGRHIATTAVGGDG